MTHNLNLPNDLVVDELVSNAVQELSACTDMRAGSVVLRKLGNDIQTKTREIDGRSCITGEHRKHLRLALESALGASEFYESYPYQHDFGWDKEKDDEVLSPIAELEDILSTDFWFKTIYVHDGDESTGLVKAYLRELTQEANWLIDVDEKVLTLPPLQLTAEWMQNARDAVLDYWDGPKLILYVTSAKPCIWAFRAFGDMETDRQLLIFDLAPEMEVFVQPGTSSVEERGSILTLRNVSLRLNVEFLLDSFSTVAPLEFYNHFEWSSEHVDNLTLEIDRETGAIAWTNLKGEDD